MRQDELREAAKCSICRQGVMACGLPLFYRIKIERFGILMDAVKRQAGLEMMLGSPMLGRVMSPDEEMAKPVMDPVTITVCEACSTDQPRIIASLAAYEDEGSLSKSTTPRREGGRAKAK